MVYHLFCDTQTQWKWELRTNAGKVIAVSGTCYRTRDNCLSAIRAVQKSGTAAVAEYGGPSTFVREETVLQQLGGGRIQHAG